MILKNIDSKKETIRQLNELLLTSTSEKQKSLIKTELKKLKNGYESEKENCYFLDFAFKKSENTILLHDLRIEHKGRTAQIDHILISRRGIEVLESKSFAGEATIEDDLSFTIKYGSRKFAEANPLEQCKRHAEVLKDLLSESVFFKNAIGQEINITTAVLINPNTIITNKKLPDDFYKADSYASKRFPEDVNMSVLKVLSLLAKFPKAESRENIARYLLSRHKPVTFDYTKRYIIKKEKETTDGEPETIVEKVVKEKNIKNKEVWTNALKEGSKCPGCGIGTLKLRNTKAKKAKEKYGNDSFLGCSRYPFCKYTLKQ